MSTDPNYCCKITRSLGRYGRDAYAETVENMYRDGDASLRDLEREINRVIAEGAVTAAASEATPIDISVEQIITAVRDGNELSRREKARIKSRLENAGLDPERLRKDLVTYRTVKNHLNDCVDVDTSRKKGPITREEAKDTIGWAEHQYISIATRTLLRLQSAGKTNLSDDFDLSSRTVVTCNACGDTVRLSDLLAGESCSC